MKLLLILLTFLFVGKSFGFPTRDEQHNQERQHHHVVESDGETSRKVLGSSVVTSVSVILDSGNGSQAYFSDAVGKPVSKPQTGTQVASPINLLNPDRYEFYTFDDNGDLIKRLMTLDEIQGIIANGDGDTIYANNNNNLNDDEQQKPEKHVDEIVNSVQNVLKEEMETLRPSDHNSSNKKPVLDTPDVSSTWSMILPAIFGNSGEDIKPVIKPNTAMTPDTIMIEDIPTTTTTTTTTATTTTTTTTSQKPQDVITTESAALTTVKIAQETTTKDDTNLLPTTTIITDLSKEAVNSSFVIKEEESDIFEEPKPNDDRQDEFKQAPTIIPSESTSIKDALLDESSTNTIADTVITSTLPQVSVTSTPEADNSKQSSTIVEVLLPKDEDVITTTQYDKKTEQATLVPTTTNNIVTTIKTSSLALDDAESSTNAVIEEKPNEIQVPETTVQDKLEETTLQITTIKNIPEKIAEVNSNDIITSTISSELFNNAAATTFESLRLTTEATFSPTTINHEQEQQQNVEIAEILNQLLLTTTNIYEINTELSNTKDDFETNPIIVTTPESVELKQETEQSDTKNVITTGNTQTDKPYLNENADTINVTAESSTIIENYKNVTETFDEVKPEEDSVKDGQQSQKPNKVDADQKIEAEEKDETPDNLEKSNIAQSSIKDVVEAISEKLIVAESTENLNVIHSTENDVQSPTEYNTDDETTETNTFTTATEKGALHITENNEFNATEDQDAINNSENVEVTKEIQNDELTSKPEVLEDIYERTTIVNNQPEEMTTILNRTISTTYSTDEDVNLIESTTVQAQIKDETTKTILSNIEELISNSSNQQSQDDVVNVASNSANVEAILEDSKSKPMETVQEETATVASQLLDSEKISSNDYLEDSFNSLLSQISPDKTESTTIEGYVTNSEETFTFTPTVTTMNTIKSDDTKLDQIKVKPTLAYKYETANESNKNTTLTTSVDRTEVASEQDVYNNNNNSSDQIKKDENVPEIVENTTQLETNVEEKKEKPIEETSNAPPAQETDKVPEKSAETEVSEEIKPIAILSSTTERDTSVIKNTTEEIDKLSVNLQHDKVSNNIDDLKIKHTDETSTNNVKIANDEDTITKVDDKPLTVSVANKSSEYLADTSTFVKNDSIVKDTESKDTSWTLVSTVSPQNVATVLSTKPTTTTPKTPEYTTEVSKPVNLINNNPTVGYGLEDSTSDLDTDVYRFVELCNELAFGFWKSVTNGISSARSVIVSPFAANSLLAMVFLGARGATSGEMNEILRLDDMVTFNPHLIFKNVSESIENLGKKTGVAISSIVRELYSDRSKGKLLGFYKERAKQFYDGHVEEVSFKEIGDLVRRRTNMIVKTQTSGRIPEYVKDTPINLRAPLAGVSASIFQTDCSDASTDGRDGELYFVVSPSIRQRRLVPVPAAVWRNNFLAGYDPVLDATAVSIGMKEQVVSTIFVLPGQQGIAAPGDGLTRLEKRLVDSAFQNTAWSRLLRTLIPRPGLEVQIPRFSHRSVINATNGLQRMGLKDLFNAEKADLRGLNGVANELYLSDILQINNFATCAELPLGETHHMEIYPATSKRQFRKHRKLEMRAMEDEEPRDYQRAFHDPLHDPTYLSLPLSLRPRQARLPETPRLRFDRPFLYFVRHNPTGLILHMGRFNPRLLP